MRSSVGSNLHAGKGVPPGPPARAPASRASAVLALGVALGGVVAAMLLGWAAQPGAGTDEKPAERPQDQSRKAA